MFNKTVTSIMLLAGIVSAAGLPNFANRTIFANEQKANVTKFLTEAENLVSDPRLYQYFMDQCIVQQVYPQLFSMPAGFVKPFKAFDNLYFVGHTSVHAWAIDTGDGIIVIDTLNNQSEIENVMLPMFAELGLKPENIKSVIITHEHLDHYGGALYLQDTYNATVYGAEAFWVALAALPANSVPPPPRRGVAVGDGDGVTLGNTTINILETPGHTLGTISLSFPVTDNGEPHIAGLMGGTGTPAQQNMREMKVASGLKFAQYATDTGIDVLISNHQVADHSVQNADILEHLSPGEANPFVLGNQNFVNYLLINAVCSQVIAARQGMNLNVGGNSTAGTQRRNSHEFFARAFAAEVGGGECNH
ncbi:beta-lactamase-like protein [Pyrenochaeta sp. MPI-SDFR-AT-0127]|nr:beta-lactamase-like protein [Pyrenochaeta sp. MPI-SDFR-AT-0127]